VYVLDTNILSAMRFEPAIVRKNDVCTTAINVWEIERGARRRPSAADLRSFARFVRENIPVLPFDEDAAVYYASLSRRLDPDAMIAAITITQKMTLVTRNEARFAAYEGLEIVRW
jgi:predicted nucleic acid-binding protein